MLSVNTIIFLIILSLIPVSLSMLLDFVLGHPGKDEINDKAILFGYTYFLAKNRLKKKIGWQISIYTQLKEGYREERSLTNSAIQNNNLDRNFKKSVVVNAKEFFTWEHAFGICIFCTGVWISLIFATTLYIHGTINFFFIPLIILFSHFLLRKLN